MEVEPDLGPSAEDLKRDLSSCSSGTPLAVKSSETTDGNRTTPKTEDTRDLKQDDGARTVIGFVTTGFWSTDQRRGVGSAFCAAHLFLELQQKARATPNHFQHHNNFVLVRCSQQSVVLRPAFVFLTTTA